MQLKCVFVIRQRCMYLVIALVQKFVNEAHNSMRWTPWQKCIMQSISEMNDVGIKVYTNWRPLQRRHRRIETRCDDTFLKAPSFKQSISPFFWQHPDAMDAFKKYGVCHLKELSIELMHCKVHNSLIPATMKSLGESFDNDRTNSNNLKNIPDSSNKRILLI